MSIRKPKTIDEIAAKIRMTVSRTMRTHGPDELFTGILKVLDDRDILLRRNETLEWMLHADGKEVPDLDDLWAAEIKAVINKGKKGDN